jgi:hypothetical protein
MLDFYLNLPIWLGAMLVLGTAVVICVGGHVLVRRLAPNAAPKQETEYAVALMAVVGAFIGIMLAFAALQVWEDYAEADAAVAHEAASLSELYRDLSVYGDETLKARDAEKAYVRAVLQDEWPRLAHGESGPKAVAALIQLYREAGALQPADARQTVLYGEIFKQLNEVVQHRRERTVASRAALPGLFWAVVLIGSAVIVGFTFVFPATRVNALLTAGLAISLGLIFIFILSVDHPFAGRYAVDNKELRDLLPLFDQIAAPRP